MSKRRNHSLRGASLRVGAVAITLAMAVALLPGVVLAAPGAAAPSPSPWSLTYQVYHVVTTPGTPGELWLVAHNPTPQWVTLTFPTSQRVDFVLWRDWQPVWRASDGQVFSQVVQTEVIGPYQARVYQVPLPGTLVPGSYYVSAYLTAQNMGRYPVAWTEIWIDGKLSAPAQLSYALSARTWGWQDPGRLGFSLSNPRATGVYLEYPAWWAVKVAVYDRDGEVVWEKAVPRTVAAETMAAGSSRYYSFPLPWLAPGTYVARAWFSPAGPGPVAEISFTR